MCIGATLVTLGAIAVIGVELQGGLPPRFNSKPHEAAGWFLAQQALGLLQPGGRVIVITRDTTAFNNPATDVQLDSFRKALRRAHATLGRIHLLQVDPLRPVEVPSGDFVELIRATPKGSVIVSFMGPPVLTEGQRRQLGDIKPAIIAFCPGELPELVDLRVLFAQGLLQAAVISRTQGIAAGSPPHDMQGWFDQEFVAITASNVAGCYSEAGL